MAAPLLVVDAPSMLFRAFYALPAKIVGPDGRPVNALLGSANLILREVEIHQPRAVVLCFGPDAASYRTELYPAYHAKRAEEMPGERDMYQCAGKGVTVLYVRTGGKGAEEVGPEQVRERYGIGPELVPDFIALRGDPSDGLPGAKGVGPKTAAELLRKHGSLEAILDNAIRESRPALRGALIDGS